MHLQPFGTGECAIKYLGAYVCRTAIGDSRIAAIHGDNVTFRWKDRANGHATRTDKIPGVEFVARYRKLSDLNKYLHYLCLTLNTKEVLMKNFLPNGARPAWPVISSGYIG